MAAVSPTPSPLLPPPPSSSKVEPEAAGKAVEALLKWSKSRNEDQKPQLLEQDDFFYLILTLKKIPPKGRTNPYKIPLPHSLHPMDASEELCLIIDDRSKSSLSSESAKKKIKSEDIPISKVLKLSKLKTDYRAFESKRKLCDSYDMFFADKRIIPLLPKLLGKQFFKKKKIPVPVELTHKNWKEQIERASGSALLYLRTGTCSVIKVGKLSQSKDELIENVIAAVEGVVEIIPKKWANVRSLHLKMAESLALPIYQAVPDMGFKIEGVKKNEEIEDEAEPMEEGGTEEKKEKKKVAKKKKGRIHEVRYMDDLPGEVVDAMDDISGEVSDDDVVVVAEDKKIELGSGELKEGKKRKKAEKSKKERVLDGSNEKKPAGDAAKQERVVDEKQSKKKSAKVKKVEAVKLKDGLSSEKKGNGVVGGTPSSAELKKTKKKSKTSLESGEKKMKSKKNRTKPMA